MLSHTAIVELWVEYAIGNLFILMRFYGRWSIVGFRFQWEDVFMFLAWIFYAVANIGSAKVFGLNASDSHWDGENPQVSEERFAEFNLSAKLGFSIWVLFIGFFWSLKGVMMALYFKLANGLQKETKVLIGVSVFIFASFMACFLLHMLTCLPIQSRWLVNGTSGNICESNRLDVIVTGFLNAITDACIVIIPLPLLLRANLRMWRKVLLAFLLCSGVFIIAATIVRVAFTLAEIHDFETLLLFGSREACVATVAVSIPAMRPLFRNVKCIAPRTDYYVDRPSDASSAPLRPGGSGSSGGSASRRGEKEFGAPQSQFGSTNSRPVVSHV